MPECIWLDLSWWMWRQLSLGAAPGNCVSGKRRSWSEMIHMREGSAGFHLLQALLMVSPKWDLSSNPLLGCDLLLPSCRFSGRQSLPLKSSCPSSVWLSQLPMTAKLKGRKAFLSCFAEPDTLGGKQSNPVLTKSCLLWSEPHNDSHVQAAYK